jgi:hypothetical protein
MGINNNNNNNHNPYGNIKYKKIALLKLISRIGGSDAVSIGELKNYLDTLPHEFSEGFDLNYTTSALYRNLDRMMMQNLLEKFTKIDKPKTHKFIKISEFGLMILGSARDLFGDD